MYRRVLWKKTNNNNNFLKNHAINGKVGNFMEQKAVWITKYMDTKPGLGSPWATNSARLSKRSTVFACSVLITLS